MTSIAVASLVTTTLFTYSGVALAESPPPAQAQSVETPPVLKQGCAGVLGGVNDSPFLLGAIAPIDHMLIGAGLSFDYNGDGQTDAAGNKLNDKVASNLVLAVQYMVFDKSPFAMGPEIFLVGSLAPGKAFDYLLVRPGWGFWYTPWQAPIAIGSALTVEVTVPTQDEQKVTLSSLTPGLRLGYIFNGI